MNANLTPMQAAAGAALQAVIVVLAVGLLGGCTQRTAAIPPAAVTALETAYNRNDPDACVALFADDGQVLPDGARAVVGRQALRAFFADQISRDLSFDVKSELNIARADLGVDQGRYTVRNVRRGVDVEEGKYVTVWRRYGNEWKVSRLIFNTDRSRDVAISIQGDPEGAPESR